jgi:hypothetical protein
MSFRSVDEKTFPFLKGVGLLSPSQQTDYAFSFARRSSVYSFYFMQTICNQQCSSSFSSLCCFVQGGEINGGS